MLISSDDAVNFEGTLAVTTQQTQSFHRRPAKIEQSDHLPAADHSISNQTWSDG
jgi:hypothetical protein